MIAYDDALELLLRHARRLEAEPCPVAAAQGRVLAQDVVSPMDLPSFDHAAMDGYAMHAHGAIEAGTEHDVQGSQAAGDGAHASAGCAWEIMTGASLPAGLDTVVPVERTQRLSTHADGSPARIRITETIAARANVRYAGSDVPQGALVLKAGTRLDASHAMLLAALGVTEVAVCRAPHVAIICTGKELQPDASQPLRDGQIYGSNGPYLVAAFEAAGARVLACETVDDTSDTFVAAVQRARDAGVDLIVSTGAVSMGRYDFVPDALTSLGARTLFHKVAIRPGKPQLAAVLGDAVVFALPGTPMAVAVGLRFFVTPLLRAMRGQSRDVVWHAVLDAPVQVKTGWRHFLRATVTQDQEGRLRAQVSAQQQPFRIQPFADASAWVVLPEDAGDVDAGSRVVIAGLQPDASMLVSLASGVAS